MLRAALRTVLFILLSHTLQACGTASKATPYVSLSEEQEARKALDAKDFERAIELYKALIEAEPETYARYPFLATAYAGQAGFDIFETLVESVVTSQGSHLSPVDVIKSALPADPNDLQLQAMASARDTILAIPADLRSKTNAEASYASSAALQLEFYQAAYPLMYMNRFVAKTSSGSLDPDRLASMTPEDAAAILDSLRSAEGLGGDLGTAVSSVLSEIDAQPGADTKEKLIQYLSTHSS